VALDQRYILHPKNGISAMESAMSIENQLNTFEG
jgi:hypothetical protein